MDEQAPDYDTLQMAVRDYDALKAFGHSPAKAAEIVLDAKRGDWFSRRWIDMARAGTPKGSSQ